MSEALVPLDPNSEQAKHAVMALLGATLAELKQIDQTVVGSSTNIKGMKTDLKNVFNTLQQPAPQPVVQQPTIQYSNPVATAVNAGINLHPVQAQHNVQTAPPEDPNQLVFDFNKPITPDTINDKLDRILDKLSTVIDLLKT